jgi:hypothetical protein
MWHKFAQEFMEEFCPKNKIQMAQMDLKMVTYFQGSCTINEYIDGSKEMVDKGPLS